MELARLLMDAGCLFCNDRHDRVAQVICCLRNPVTRAVEVAVAPLLHG